MKSMFGYMGHQPFELSQATLTLPSVTSHIVPINRHTHTHNALVCKGCTTRQAQSHAHTASLSLIIHYTRRTVHTGDEAFKKGAVVDSLALKIQTYFKKRPTEKIFGQTTFKKRPKKVKRQTRKSYGQPT